MSIQLLSMKCPECGATLSIESNREFAFCSYCGTKIMVHNENEYIQKNINESRIIDEARIKEAETAQILRLRELELLEKDKVRKHKNKRNTYIVALILVVGGALLSFVFPLCAFGVIYGLCLAFITFLKSDEETSDTKTEKYMNPLEVALTESMVNCVGENYEDVESEYRAAGFKNIILMPMGDLTLFSRKKEGLVVSVSINGSKKLKVGEIVPKASHIEISYHSKYGEGYF